MNGQDRKLINKVQNDIIYNIAKLETKIEERWKARDKWQAGICGKFDKIFEWLEGLPCQGQQTDIQWIKKILYGGGAVITAAVVAIMLRLIGGR